MRKEFFMTLKGVYGGPCPICGHEGFLREDSGDYGPDAVRTLVHSSDEGEQRCQVRLGSWILRVDLDGMWSLIPRQ